jgi:hypothetical protein
MWLDSHLKPGVEQREGVAGELWSVHSGGFYRQIKFMVAPSEMPEELHWFKWEAYTTWISGFLLLALMFYVGADLNLIDKARVACAPGRPSRGPRLAGRGLGDLRRPLPLAHRAEPEAFQRRLVPLLTPPAGPDPHLLRPRRLHARGRDHRHGDGGQRLCDHHPQPAQGGGPGAGGETPDPSLGKQAKQRSVHNNYMTLPCCSS